jgi:hypothetical protein
MKMLSSLNKIWIITKPKWYCNIKKIPALKVWNQSAAQTINLSKQFYQKTNQVKNCTKKIITIKK